MLYRFDIRFKKRLSGGGLKVVTYTSLLETPGVFGHGETLAGAVGELSLVQEGTEKDYSINALVQKYGAGLIGRQNAYTFGKALPIQFLMADDHDVSSLRIEVKDDEGHLYTPEVKTLSLNGENTFDLRNNNSFVCIACQEGTCTLTDDTDRQITLSQGQLAFCAATAQELTIDTNKVELLWFQ